MQDWGVCTKSRGFMDPRREGVENTLLPPFIFFNPHAKLVKHTGLLIYLVRLIGSFYTGSALNLWRVAYSLWISHPCGGQPAP